MLYSVARCEIIQTVIFSWKLELYDVFFQTPDYQQIFNFYFTDVAKRKTLDVLIKKDLQKKEREKQKNMEREQMEQEKKEAEKHREETKKEAKNDKTNDGKFHVLKKSRFVS